MIDKQNQWFNTYGKQKIMSLVQKLQCRKRQLKHWESRVQQGIDQNLRLKQRLVQVKLIKQRFLKNTQKLSSMKDKVMSINMKNQQVYEKEDPQIQQYSIIERIEDVNSKNYEQIRDESSLYNQDQQGRFKWNNSTNNNNPVIQQSFTLILSEETHTSQRNKQLKYCNDKKNIGYRQSKQNKSILSNNNQSSSSRVKLKVIDNIFCSKCEIQMKPFQYFNHVHQP